MWKILITFRLIPPPNTRPPAQCKPRYILSYKSITCITHKQAGWSSCTLASCDSTKCSTSRYNDSNFNLQWLCLVNDYWSITSSSKQASTQCLFIIFISSFSRIERSNTKPLKHKLSMRPSFLASCCQAVWTDRTSLALSGWCNDHLPHCLWFWGDVFFAPPTLPWSGPTSSATTVNNSTPAPPSCCKQVFQPMALCHGYYDCLCRCYWEWQTVSKGRNIFTWNVTSNL